MATDDYIKYNGVELINTARTVHLAPALGIDTVWVTEDSVEWIPEALGVDPTAYANIANAPWYDAGVVASAEFAGLIPLSVVGLDDSTLTSTPIEYITDGGHSGLPRNETLPIVFNVAIIASTERGAEFGRRWLDRTINYNGRNVFCAGAMLEYFRYGDQTLSFDVSLYGQAHRNDVRTTRGTSVTRKRKTHCSATWMVTFTMTAADPFEYGNVIASVIGLGHGMEPNENVADSGVLLGLMEQTCPQFDYSPIYDPLHPALVPAPSPPDFYPDGWGIEPGMTYDRYWALMEPIEPSMSLMVPRIAVYSTVEARRIRVCIWPGLAELDSHCDPLFSAVITYTPGGTGQVFVVDGEFKACYMDNATSNPVRRTDSLVYDIDAQPVDWTAFNDPDGLLVTLDIFSESDFVEGDGTVEATVSFIPKSG